MPVCCCIVYLVPTYQCISVHLLQPSISQSSRAGRWRPRYHSWRHCIIASGFLRILSKWSRPTSRFHFCSSLRLQVHIPIISFDINMWSIFQSLQRSHRREVYPISKVFAPSFSQRSTNATHSSWAISTVPPKAWRYVSAPDVYAKCSSISKLHKLAPTSICHVQIHQRMHPMASFHGEEARTVELNHAFHLRQSSNSALFVCWHPCTAWQFGLSVI